MRLYPRIVCLPGKQESRKTVNSEAEEIEASEAGYESGWNPEVIAKRKGTENEILRVKPVVVVDAVINPVVEPESVITLEQKPLTRGQKAWATRLKNKQGV